MQEDMESGEGFEVQREKKSGFGRGVLIGAAGTLLAGAVALFAFLSVFGEGSVFFGQKESLSIALSDQVKSKVNELIGYIHLYFYDDVEEEQLAEGIYSGLLSGLDDKYTQYYTAQEYADLQISATQNYCGIGAGLSQDRDTMQVTVTHVYDGSPAQKAGILDGDVLVMVEGIESVSMELSDLVTHIRGEEGTKVHLQIYREGEEDYLEIDVERANIDLPTVSHKLLDGEIWSADCGAVCGGSGGLDGAGDARDDFGRAGQSRRHGDGRDGDPGFDLAGGSRCVYTGQIRQASGLYVG